MSVQHGTLSAYAGATRCRCEPCIEAGRAYRQEYKQRLAEGLLPRKRVDKPGRVEREAMRRAEQLADPNSPLNERRRRAERMLKAYIDDGLTITEIARRHGVTRQRVSQVLQRYDPTKYALAVDVRRRRDRALRALNDGVPKLVICRTCGELFESGPRRVFCSPAHRLAYQCLQYHVDDERRAAQLHAIARWTLDNSDDPRQVRSARRRLAGESEDHGRWLVHGSLPFHWALRAHALQWPIFDELPPPIRQQVEAASASA